MYQQLKSNIKSFFKWVWSERGKQSFIYDSTSAMWSDLVIYVGPSGKDAAAECGMAYAKEVPIIGLHAKSEDFGLMRRMMKAWFYNYKEILSFVDELTGGEVIGKAVEQS